MMLGKSSTVLQSAIRLLEIMRPRLGVYLGYQSLPNQRIEASLVGDPKIFWKGKRQGGIHRKVGLVK